MSIRLRLTLLYTAILALALIVFGTALYASQARFTLDIAKDNLARQADLFARGPRRGPDPDNDRGPGGYLAGRWTQLRGVDGSVLARTPDLGAAVLPLSNQGLGAVQGGANWFETADVENEPVLIYSQPLFTQNRVAGIVQVAAPISEREQALQTLRLILFVGSLIVILAAFAVSWFVAGTALDPIHRITRTMQAIGAEQNLSRRVQYQGPNDEVGQLATTFNAMLAQLESAYRQLQHALESQRRFVADASHELRTPLTTVRGNIELLHRDPPMDAPERTEVLGDTKDEVERLIRLVNQLLVLARADAGQRLAFEPVPLAPLLDDVCRQTKLIAPERNIEWDNLPEVTVKGNRDALKQVFLILLDNAVVHTPPEAAIRVRATMEGGHVAIHFRDTGPGIAPNALPHLFERFYRGDVARSGRSTGLGLAIAKDLVEAQDGTLTVASRVGEGTEFTVRLNRV